MDYYDAKREIVNACQHFATASRSQIQAFNGLVKGKNFMTPDVEAWVALENGKYVAEISLGTGFNAGTYVYGVTVIERDSYDKWNKSDGLSKCCHSGSELRHYLTELDSTEEDEDESED